MYCRHRPLYCVVRYRTGPSVKGSRLKAWLLCEYSIRPRRYVSEVLVFNSHPKFPLVL